MHVCINMNAQRDVHMKDGCHPQGCPPPPLRQLSDLEITDWAVMGDQQGLRMLWFLPSPCWGYLLAAPSPAFVCGIWGSHSGPHSCKVSSVVLEPCRSCDPVILIHKTQVLFNINGDN